MTRKWKELEEGFSSVSTRYDFSEESKRLQSHLFSDKDIQRLMQQDRNISVKKIGYGIYYLVKIVKID